LTNTKLLPKQNSRRSVELANPQPGCKNQISKELALHHCACGLAYWTKDGKIQYRASFRLPSDVYVKGVISWRGNAKDYRRFYKPGEVCG
jgi:hypothetical protein